MTTNSHAEWTAQQIVNAFPYEEAPRFLIRDGWMEFLGRTAAMRRQDAALEGKEGAILWVASASNGQKLAQYHLQSLPVWDGMAAAGGRLYMTMVDGRVVCWNSQ